MILIKLTENDKRLLFAILLVVILLLVVIGLIGKLVLYVMNRQGHRLDGAVKDVVYYRAQVCPDKKQFRKYAKAKNNQIFFRKIWIPLVILAVSFLFLAIAETTCGRSWNYDPFNHVDGFGTLLFIWDIRGVQLSDTFLGFKIWSTWPALLENYGKPQFVADAWASYLFVPLAITGICIYLYDIQAWIARYLRIRRIVKKYYETNLDENIGSAPGANPPAEGI